MKNKKLDHIGELFFDEKTQSLHQMTQTGFDSADDLLTGKLLLKHHNMSVMPAMIQELFTILMG